MSAKKLKTSVADFETDPFSFGATLNPYCWGWFDGDDYQSEWEPTGAFCARHFADFLAELDGYKVYMHNGGKFDFQFLIPFVDTRKIRIIGNRIVSMYVGDTLLIDSMALMPFALSEYQKTEIDYDKFTVENRRQNKKEILKYLYDDCVDLYNLLTGFQKVVGDHLTIGSAAFANMKKLGIEIPRTNKTHDEQFRPFFYGGRTEAFVKGYHPRQKLKYIDLNSAYPWAMTFKHPCCTGYNFSTKKPKNKLQQSFIHLKASPKGAFPFRQKNNSLSFPTDKTTREYRVTGWEYKAAVETGALKKHELLAVWTPHLTMDFKAYVNTFFPAKADAAARGDLIAKLSYKYLLNSGYGKLATDPDRFAENALIPIGDYMPEPWEPVEDLEIAPLTLWERPSASRYDAYYDVATGASITGFVRAALWRALNAVDTPYYCDTDSIICAGCDALKMGDGLGEWGDEYPPHVTDYACYGKKGYTVLTTTGKRVTASKGVVADYTEIIRAAEGETVEIRRQSPTYKMGKATYITRKIKST